jgi:hypothetical protein
VKNSFILFSLAAAVMSCSMMKTKQEDVFKKSAATKVFTKKSKIKRSIASQEGLTPNEIRYQENGAKPETGKSGLRQIESWGLMDINGMTTVYVTTGSLVNVTTEDNSHITKVQIKALNTNGDVLLNKEFNQLSNDGSYSFSTDQLTRSQKYSLMSHVSIDSEKRNFVVTTNNKVYLLPDLKDESLKVLSRPSSMKEYSSMPPFVN